MIAIKAQNARAIQHMMYHYSMAQSPRTHALDSSAKRAFIAQTMNIVNSTPSILANTNLHNVELNEGFFVK
jgi:hypothetical protein